MGLVLLSACTTAGPGEADTDAIVSVTTACGESEVTGAMATYLERWTVVDRLAVEDPCVLTARPGP